MNKRSYDMPRSLARGVRQKYSYMLLNHGSATVELNRILMSKIVNVGSHSSVTRLSVRYPGRPREGLKANLL